MTEEINQELSQLNEREQACVLLFAKRLVLGRKRYGELKANDTRDWQQEMMEELLDQAAYGTFILTQQGDR